VPIQPDQIIDQLPDLRRYATALLGHRARADRLVEAALEHLLADQAQVRSETLRPTLFTIFDQLHRQASTLPADAAWAATEASKTRLHAALERLPIEERKVLLMISMAHFSEPETAAILGISVAAAAARAQAARERLHRALACRVLMVQSDPLMALSLAHTVRHLGHQLCGIVQTRGDVLARRRDRLPDLVLADVWLRDGSDGIATVNELLRGAPIPVILLASGAVAAAALQRSLVIRKPFTSGVLEAAMRRILDAVSL
jgi:DNA-directed RNA polymerase specialized sigma24 family protein